MSEHDPNCIFCKIVAGQIPCRKAYEDEDLLAFHDIAPWAPVHVLVIPKQHIESLYDTTPEQHQALLGLAQCETGHGHQGLQIMLRSGTVVSNTR